MTATPPMIRHAVPDDAAAIADVYNEAVRTTTATFDTEPQSVEKRLQWLHDHDERHPVFVAVIDGQVVGWASLNKWSDRPADIRTDSGTKQFSTKQNPFAHLSERRTLRFHASSTETSDSRRVLFQTT